MSDKQFLDYDGLEHYHNKLKQSLGSDSPELEGRVATLESLVKFLDEKQDLISAGLAKVEVTLHDEFGEPLVGWTVTNMSNRDGSEVLTDENGFAEGYVSAGSKAISSSKYSDMDTFSAYENFVSGKLYSYERSLSYRNYLSYYYSDTLTFSGHFTKASFSIVGGGGGGGGSLYGGSGGGGGGIAFGELDIIKDTPYTLYIGSGGSGGYYSSGNTTPVHGGYGGSSTFNGVTASGASGGQGNSDQYHSLAGGSGGGGTGGASYPSTQSGSNGRSGFYSSFTGTSDYGGGGGGGSRYSVSSRGVGGSPNGGDGGYATNYDSTQTDAYNKYTSHPAQSGSSPGGGGGGGLCGGKNDTSDRRGGSGGRGGIGIRLT